MYLKEIRKRKCSRNLGLLKNIPARIINIVVARIKHRVFMKAGWKKYL